MLYILARLMISERKCFRIERYLFKTFFFLNCRPYKRVQVFNYPLFK